MTPTDHPDPDPQVLLRPAEPADLAEVAALHLRARRAAVPAMPPLVHTAAEVTAHITGWDLVEREVWLAESGDRLLGYAALSGDWLDDLYVDPDLVGRGIGSMLLDLVKALRPHGLGLWVFESNTGARRFYAAHGFVEIERTDGSGNEERSPDLRLSWPAR